MYLHPFGSRKLALVCGGRSTRFFIFTLLANAIITISLLVAWPNLSTTPSSISKISSMPRELPLKQDVRVAANVSGPHSFRYLDRLPKKMVDRFIEYKHDIEHMHRLMAPLATNNTVIVVPASNGYLNMALNLQCRLSHFGLGNNVLFWALDKNAADRLEAANHTHFFDPNLYAAPDGNFGFYDVRYIKMMSERPKVWWKMLATGFDIFFMDADIVMFRNPLKLLARASHTTMEGQIDEFNFQLSQNRSAFQEVCAGFFWLQSDHLGLTIAEKIIESYENRTVDERWDDQGGMNHILHNGFVPIRVLNRAQSDHWKRLYNTTKEDRVVRFRFFEPYHVLSGHLSRVVQIIGKGDKTRMYVKALRDDDDKNTMFEEFYRNDPNMPTVFTPYVFHLNSVGDKESNMKNNEWWYLDENNSCLHRKVA